MVKVYCVRIWDQTGGKHYYPEAKLTMDGVRVAKGEIVPGTEEEVSEDAIDGQYAVSKRWRDANRP